MRYIVVMSVFMMMQGCFGFGATDEKKSVDIIIECDNCDHLRITKETEVSSGVDSITIGPAGGGNQ